MERFATVLDRLTTTPSRNGKLALLVGSAQSTVARSALPSFEWQQPIAIPESRSRELLIGLLTGKHASHVPLPAKDFVFWTTKADIVPES